VLHLSLVKVPSTSLRSKEQSLETQVSERVEDNDDGVTVKTVSMRPRQWAIVDGEAAAMGASRSLALRYIVDTYERLKALGLCTRM